ERGGSLDARSYWAKAALKAESVVARHPRSRWAEPALVLQGEGLAKSGACDRATSPLETALRAARSEALRERAALALAECALAANAPGAAAPHLVEVTRSRDAGRRSQAALLAGRAAELAGDAAAAAQWYGRSTAAAAAPARARCAQVVGLLPDSLEGQQAQVRVLRALAAQTDSMPDLVAVRGRLGRLGQGAAAGEARALEALLRRVLDAEAGEGSQFRTAELTRDSLGAPRLAARLFVAFTAA